MVTLAEGERRFERKVLAEALAMVVEGHLVGEERRDRGEEVPSLRFLEAS